MEREHRYYVAKIKDVEKYLSDEHQLQFDRLLTKIRIGRLNDGKADVQTVCVDSDWPEYETVWRMIEARVDGKASPASAPEGFALVPVVPTHAILDVMFNAGIDMHDVDLTLIYRAMLAAAPTPPVSEDRWLPIATAPKDRFVLLAGPSGYTTIETVFATGRMCSDYHVGRWIDHANDDLTDWGFEPTHWMPLPKAPAMQEDKP